MEAFFVSVLLVVAGVFWWHRTAAQKKSRFPLL